MVPDESSKRLRQVIWQTKGRDPPSWTVAVMDTLASLQDPKKYPLLLEASRHLAEIKDEIIGLNYPVTLSQLTWNRTPKLLAVMLKLAQAVFQTITTPLRWQDALVNASTSTEKAHNIYLVETGINKVLSEHAGGDIQPEQILTAFVVATEAVEVFNIKHTVIIALAGDKDANPVRIQQPFFVGMEHSTNLGRVAAFNTAFDVREQFTEEFATKLRETAKDGKPNFGAHMGSAQPLALVRHLVSASNLLRGIVLIMARCGTVVL
ncbi:hypothetical protein OIO90_002963 [Microbotryomycetes sp. JL221]|nr:hypothetical protein OIO90_002963 [Microbotryomycetes sp. JL221]